MTWPPWTRPTPSPPAPHTPSTRRRTLLKISPTTRTQTCTSTRWTQTGTSHRARAARRRRRRHHHARPRRARRRATDSIALKATPRTPSTTRAAPTTCWAAVAPPCRTHHYPNIAARASRRYDPSTYHLATPISRPRHAHDTQNTGIRRDTPC